MDVVYFELNNWFSGRDYPNTEPFITWCGYDSNLYFDNIDWIKENKLVVIGSIVDMSCNWCITAPKQWVLDNCPDLLSNKTFDFTVITYKDGKNIERSNSNSYSSFLRYPDEDGDVYGRFGTKFLEYSEENIGFHLDKEDN